MSQVLREIKRNRGRYAVVGVPCFIKAVNLLRRQDPVLRERIRYTLGLFCGHMKSARMLESFARQMDVPLDSIVRSEFRIKDPTRPASTYTAEFECAGGEIVRRDWWNLVEGDWGSGFFMASACNFCDDVVAETADISFGDAWVEPYSSDGRGTNVIVVRSSLLERLLNDAVDDGRLDLRPVDAEFVRETQAAGFRQRREGLSYRLTWPRIGIKPRKRVAPSRNLTGRRKLTYRIRAHISVWSHRIYRFSCVLRWPGLYHCWGRLVVRVYHGLAYSRGRVGSLIDRLLGSE
jgi:coenzyme F420-reducing hydrogenase beta subunit